MKDIVQIYSKGFKALFKGVIEATAGTVVFGLCIAFGMVYNTFYSIWLAVTLKNILAPLKFWSNVLAGFLIFIGRLLHHYAVALDIYANVNAEIIEDVITPKENTSFGDPNTTISASIGKLEIEGKLNKVGKRLSIVLNWAFWQKQHAIDSYNYKVAHDAMLKQFFTKLR